MITAELAEDVPVRVLIIEDDEEDHLIVDELLTEAGGQRYLTTWIRDYAQAVEALEARQHDICLVDFRLGADSGLDLLKLAPVAHGEIPAIVLTGLNNPEADLQAMQAGAADYLEKTGLNARLLERSIRYTLCKRRAEQALRHSEERYALAAAGSNDGLWDWDLIANTIYFSPRWLDMVGYVEDPFAGNVANWFASVHPDDINCLRRAIGKHREGKTAYLKQTYRIRHHDGHYLWMLCRGKAVRNAEGKAVRIAGSQTDITELKQHQAKMEREALHDALTGLPNKTMLLEHLRVLLAQRHSQSKNCAVLFLDLDDFKHINDSYGHELGDRLLVKIAHRLKSNVKGTDSIAHFGADEFVILLTDLSDVEQAGLTTQNLMEALHRPFVFGDQEIFVSSTIGVVYVTADDERTADEVLRDADTALYEAKQGSKSRHSLFNEKMREKAVRVMQLKTDLQKALPANELQLFYQPIISLETDAVDGFEALLRWEKPGQGMISPGDFIPLAEETGLIVPIGEWIFQEASRQLHEWHAKLPHLPIYLSINLSPRQLAEPELVSQFEQLIRESDVDPGFLRIEVTENSIMQNEENAREQLTRLQQLGMVICMDDFGTGYSSLSMLNEFPIDVLKIDQTFINRLDQDDTRGQQMVSSILAIAQIFDVGVVAEGVETEYQASLLRGYGCKYVQGYHFAKPMNADMAFDYLAASTSRNSTNASQSGIKR